MLGKAFKAIHKHHCSGIKHSHAVNTLILQMVSFSPRVLTIVPVMTLPQQSSQDRYMFDNMYDCPELDQGFQMTSVAMVSKQQHC